MSEISKQFSKVRGYDLSYDVKSLYSDKNEDITFESSTATGGAFDTYKAPNPEAGSPSPAASADPSSSASSYTADPAKHKDKYVKTFGEENYNKIRAKEQAAGLPENSLAGVIYFESRGKTDAVNKTSKATGLIQFMPKTAKALGTDIDTIKSMSFDDQLDLSIKYYKQFGNFKNIKSATDLYVRTFYPAMVNRGDDYVLGSQTSKARAKKIAKQNKAFDTNKDGKITRKEFYTWGDKKFN